MKAIKIILISIGAILSILFAYPTIRRAINYSNLEKTTGEVISFNIYVNSKNNDTAYYPVILFEIEPPIKSKFVRREAAEKNEFKIMSRPEIACHFKLIKDGRKTKKENSTQCT
ncbi:MAG: DUF3592 domain-containing protein [Cytophagaceae bacterium]|nr:DUF3592 domain-containing protein [Cytophagaceae bacterium]